MSGQTLKIHPATPSDSPRIVELTNAAFSIETFLEGDRVDEQRLSEMMQKGFFLVAEDPSATLVASIYTELRGDNGYIGMLAVDPSQQRSGIGKKMLSAAEDHLRSQGCPAVEIVVLSLRPELPAIYERAGFQFVREEPFTTVRALRPGVECHGIVMSKKL